MPSKEEPLIFAGGSSRDTTEQHPEDAFGRLGTVVEAQVKHKAAIGNSKDGHRRAQFSFKPMLSRSLPTTDFSSLDHIEDPEEYFMACERLDIADKELKRLRGEVATDLTEHQRSRTALEHRAGILGKRYHFTTSTDLTEALSKIRYDRKIVGPSDTSSVAESSDNLHREATEQPRIAHASRSLPTVDFSILDDIKDPEEYFSTFGQLEIADKELKRLSGGVATDLTQHQRSRTVREHRPGILGKKYRFTPNTDLIEALSKIPPDRSIAGPSNISSVAESRVMLHPEATDQLGSVFDATEKEGSVADKDKSAQDLLENLLSAYKTLDVDAAHAYLQKRLEVKSIDVSKTHLPELYSTQRNDRRTLDNEVAKKLDGPQLPYMPSTHIGSRIAAIPSLQSRISMINPLEDIPMPPIDVSPSYSPPSGDFDLSKDRDKQLFSSSADIDHHDTSGLHGDDASTPVTVYVNGSTFKDKMHSPILEADKTIGDKGNDKQSDGLIFAQPDPELEDLPSGYMKQNDTEILARSTISSSGHDIDADSFGLHAILQSEVNVVAEGEPVSVAQVSKNNSSPSRTVLPVNGHSENLCNLPEENDETRGLQEAAGVSPNRGQKKSVPKTRQNKQKSTSKRQKLTSRKSLADAGLIWKSGVRRSTRIKSRPLEHWCGERFLYGRIHESLATVIGVKYASPRQDGKDPALKVKSFVPKKYAHLIAKAAVS